MPCMSSDGQFTNSESRPPVASIFSHLAPAAGGEEAGGEGEVEVGEEEPFLAVGLETLERAIGADDGGGGGGAGDRVVDRGEVAGVLGGPAES